MILLDANVIIHYGKGDPVVVNHVQTNRRADLAIPAIVVFELEYGLLKSVGRSRKAIRVVLEELEHVPFDAAAARESARIRAALESAGLAIGELDLLIAGTALSRGATLATNNTREFSRVEGLRLLDWRSEEE